MKKYFLIGGLSALVLTFSQCAKNPVTGKNQVVLMSESQELAMGTEAKRYGCYTRMAFT